MASRLIRYLAVLAFSVALLVVCLTPGTQEDTVHPRFFAASGPVLTPVSVLTRPDAGGVKQLCSTKDGGAYWCNGGSSGGDGGGGSSDISYPLTGVDGAVTLAAPVIGHLLEGGIVNDQSVTLHCSETGSSSCTVTWYVPVGYVGNATIDTAGVQADGGHGWGAEQWVGKMANVAAGCAAITTFASPDGWTAADAGSYAWTVGTPSVLPSPCRVTVTFTGASGVSSIDWKATFNFGGVR